MRRLLIWGLVAVVVVVVAVAILIAPRKLGASALAASLCGAMRNQTTTAATATTTSPQIRTLRMLGSCSPRP